MKVSRLVGERERGRERKEGGKEGGRIGREGEREGGRGKALNLGDKQKDYLSRI